MRTRGPVVCLAVLAVALMGAPVAWAEEASPSPSPSDTVDVAASPSATTDVDSPTDEQATDPPSGEPAPSASPSRDESVAGTSGPVLAAAGDPAALAGSLDCQAGTLPLTLDNSTVPTATTFVVTVFDFTVATEIVHESHAVPAMESRDVVVPVPEDSSRFQVAVSADDVSLLWVELTCEPTAVVGAMDCTSETFPITLDNRTESSATSFTVTITDPTSATYFEDTYVVPAGATRVVDAPIPDNTDFGWHVVADGSWLLSSGSPAQCLPTVSVGALDCVTGTLQLTLDNSLEPAATSFTVDRRTFGVRFHATYVVLAGATQDVAVPIPDDFTAAVTVLADGNWVFGGRDDAEEYTCVDPLTHRGAVTIGDVECSTQTVPVTLDNSSSTVVVDFLVLTGDVESLVESQSPWTSDHLPVAPGGTRVVHIPAPEGDVYSDWIVRVNDLNLADPNDFIAGPTLASRTWPVVGPSIYGPIDTGCPAAPSASVQAAELANTGSSSTPALVGIALLAAGTALCLCARLTRRES